MQKWLLLLCLLCTQVLQAQRGFLYVKKKGIRKVRTFSEGSPITFITNDHETITGVIALVRRDSFYLNSRWFRSAGISRIILRGKARVAEPLLLTTAGVILSSAAMTVAKWGTFKEALGYSGGMAYGNFLVRNGPRLIKRKKYRIGRKFTVQTLDLHF